MSKSIIALSLILILSVGYLIGYETSKRKHCQDIKDILNDQEVLINTIKNFVRYGNIKVVDIVVEDVSNKRGKLSSFIDKEKMIVYLPKLGCMSCAERELEVLNQIIDIQHRNNIYIISNFDNKREQKIFERASGISCLNISDNSVFPSFLLSDVSVTFLLDSTMKSSNYLYNLDNSGQIDITKIYYSAILERFTDYDMINNSQCK